MTILLLLLTAREYLTNSDEMGIDVWETGTYDTYNALRELKKGLSDDAKICFSNCKAGASEDLGENLAILFERDVFLNTGNGGTSGLRTITKTKTEMGIVIETKKVVIETLLVPGHLSTKNTRDKGFIMYSVSGVSRNVGSIELRDNKNVPLVIPKL